METKYPYVRELDCFMEHCIYNIGLYCQCKPFDIAPNDWRNCSRFKEFRENKSGKDV